MCVFSFFLLLMCVFLVCFLLLMCVYLCVIFVPTVYVIKTIIIRFISLLLLDMGACVQCVVTWLSLGCF